MFLTAAALFLFNNSTLELLKKCNVNLHEGMLKIDRSGTPHRPPVPGHTRHSVFFNYLMLMSGFGDQFYFDKFYQNRNEKSEYGVQNLK